MIYIDLSLIGAAIACGVMFLVSVILFIVFKIPNIIGNLTGHSAKSYRGYQETAERIICH